MKTLVRRWRLICDDVVSVEFSLCIFQSNAPGPSLFFMLLAGLSPLRIPLLFRSLCNTRERLSKFGFTRLHGRLKLFHWRKTGDTYNRSYWYGESDSSWSLNAVNKIHQQRIPINSATSNCRERLRCACPEWHMVRWPTR